jgi:serine/threonine protein kinase
MATYVPEYFAIKVYVKPYLKKQRSFVRTSSCASSASSVSNESKRRRHTSFLKDFTTALDDVYKEIDIMKQIDHPNIVRLFEIIDSPSSEKLYLIMPVADYGESIEYDPSFNPYSLCVPGCQGQGQRRNDSAASLDPFC